MKRKKLHWCAICWHEMREHRGPAGCQSHGCSKLYPIHNFKFDRLRKHETNTAKA